MRPVNLCLTEFGDYEEDDGGKKDKEDGGKIDKAETGQSAEDEDVEDGAERLHPVNNALIIIVPVFFLCIKLLLYDTA